MLLLQLQLQLQAGPRVRFVRVESPAVAADRQTPLPLVGGCREMNFSLRVRLRVSEEPG
jgi:hypothetical protein